MSPDEAMRVLLDSHSLLFSPALAGGYPFVIWVTTETWKSATRGGAPWITITDPRDLELARVAWQGREDPHGWSPTAERCIAVVAPRV